MSEGDALMRMLREALRQARSGGIRKHVGLPRITVFDPPPRQRRKTAWRIPAKPRVTRVDEEQLALFPDA